MSLSRRFNCTVNNVCFLLQVYAEPLGYWKNYYNLFDFTVLVISVLQSILTALNFGQTGLTVLRVVRGLAYTIKLIINPAAHAQQGYSSWFVCLSVCHRSNCSNADLCHPNVVLPESAPYLEGF